MLAKSIISATLLVFVSSVQAHTGITPALGIQGTMVRADVQRPKNNKPCGRVDVASNIDSSTPIQANADNTFDATATNFNLLLDGSRDFKSVMVDPTGTGNPDSFVAGTMVKNGDKAPVTFGSDQVTVQMPAGMQCTGGTSGNLCIVSMKTLSGFGNCVVVQQGSNSSTSTNSTSSNSTTTDSAASSTTSAADSASTGTSSTASSNSTESATGADATDSGADDTGSDDSSDANDADEASDATDASDESDGADPSGEDIDAGQDGGAAVGVGSAAAQAGQAARASRAGAKSA